MDDAMKKTVSYDSIADKIAFKPDMDESNSVDHQMTPKDCIRAMLAYVGSDDDMLYIPEWPYGFFSTRSETSFYACKMDRRKVDEDRGKLERTFDDLMDTIKRIADKCDGLDDISEENLAMLGEQDRLFWKDYIRWFDTDDIYDWQAMNEISYKLDFNEDCRVNGQVSDEDIELYEVSDDERALHDEYVKSRFKEAEDRIGGVAAYDLIMRARRTCKLLSLSAPEIVIEGEMKYLAQAMILNRYCISKEIVEVV